MERIADRLFSVFLLILPFQAVFLFREPMIGGEKWQYGTIGIYLPMIVAGVGLSVSALVRFRKRGTEGFDVSSILRRGRRADLFLFLLVAWSGFSVLWSVDRLLAGYAFLLLLLGADVFVWTRDTVRRDGGDTVMTILAVAAGLQALLGIWQFATQETFSSTFLGTAAHPVWEAGTSVLKNGSGRWLRAYGTFPHPNAYGLFLAAGLVAATRLSVLRADPTVKRFLPAVLIPPLVFGLTVSFSRTAWLGAALGLSGLFAWKFLRDGFLKAATVPAAILILSVISATLVLGEAVCPRFDADVVAVEGSVTDRVTTYRDAWRIICESPMLGAGIGNSTATLIRLDPDRPVWDIQPAHDVPLLVFAELGVPGILLLLLFLVAFRSGFGLRDTHALAGTCLVFLPSLLSDHFLWTSPSGVLLFFVLLGTARGFADAEREHDAEHGVA